MLKSLTYPRVLLPTAVCLIGLGSLLTTALAAAETAQPTPARDSFVQKPRWEVGVAAAALSVPAYPSSAVANKRNFLVPWFIYRGDKVRLQDGGIKLIALENERLTIDVSLGASLSANSDETPLRVNMPDLDYLFEFGPKIDYRFWDRDLETGQRTRLSWQTALRFAVSTDFSSVSSRGLVLGSELSYRRDNLFGTPVSLSLSVGPTWATEKLMDYIYEVDAPFATDQRAAYDASAGYLGTDVFIGLSSKLGRKGRGFIGLGKNIHGGAENNDSPLFEKNATESIIIGLSWQLKQSRDSIRVIEQ